MKYAVKIRLNGKKLSYRVGKNAIVIKNGRQEIAISKRVILGERFGAHHLFLDEGDGEFILSRADIENYLQKHYETITI